MFKRLPEILFFGWIVLTIRSYINCFDVAVWRAEMLPIFMIVAVILRVSRSYRFSGLAYALMTVLIYMHTIGAHYTFERVPFDWFSDLFGYERNHYDRIAHFSVGFYAYAIIEYFQAQNLTKKRWVAVRFGIFAVFAVASVYEIIERAYAVSSDPNAGTAFLGSQGDIRDAQKDMLADGLGAVFASVMYMVVGKR